MRQTHIVDNFYDYVAELKNHNDIKLVQKAIKQIRENPATKSLRRHSLGRMKSRHLVSYSVNHDLRIISYEPPNHDRYLLYVDHHDEAYAWASTRRIDLDTVENSLTIIPVQWEEGDTSPDSLPDDTTDDEKDELLPPRIKGQAYLFDSLSKNELLSAGIPANYVDLVRRICNVDDTLRLISQLPGAISEILFQLTHDILHPDDGEKPSEALADQPLPQKQRFQQIGSDEEFANWVAALDEALQLDFDRWRSFLHPAQRKAVCSSSKGPVRITGGAGTGKTVVGIHRTVHLGETQFRRVHFLTFNRTLMRNLLKTVRSVFGDQLNKKYMVNTVHSYIRGRLAAERDLRPEIRFNSHSDFLLPAMHKVQPQHWSMEEPDLVFIFEEIIEIIAARKIASLEQYIMAPRKGRGRTIQIAQKEELWQIYEEAWQQARDKGWIPGELLSHYALQEKLKIPEDEALIIDEVQDLQAVDLAFLAEQAPGPNQLTLLEDQKQRIYGSGYSLKSLGINVTGRRSQKLFVNYRTTEQIGDVASLSLHGQDIDPLDLPRSLRQGKQVIVKHFSSVEQERAWLIEQVYAAEKREKKRIAILCRTRQQLEEIEATLKVEGVECEQISRDNPVPEDEVISLCTLHNSKGLEFETVFIAHLDYSLAGMRANRYIRGNKKLLEDHEKREKHLLYVATSRARDELFISGTGEILKLFD
jgi:hypothetical protein